MKQKHIHKQLCTSNSCFLHDHLRQGIIAFNRNLKITSVNEVFLEISGFSKPEDIEGESITKLKELFDIDWEKAFKLALSNIRKKGFPNDTEWSFTNLKGENQHVRASITTIKKHQKINGFLVSLFDITARKTVEKIMHTEQVRWKNFSDMLPEIVYELDLQGNVLYTNIKGLEKLGYSYSELETQKVNVAECFIESDRSRVFENMKKTFARGFQKEPSEYTMRSLNGEEFPVLVYNRLVYDNDHTPIGFQGVIIDISKQKDLENRLKESEELYRTLFESNGYASGMVNNQGIILRCNEKFLDLFEESHKENIEGKKKYFEYLVPSERKRVQQYRDQRIQGKSNPPTEYESIIQDAKGNTKNVLISVAHLVQREFSIVSITDITQQKQIEHELKDINLHLEQKVKDRTIKLEKALTIEAEMNKLKTDFISMISHEFRTPMTVIQSGNEIMKKKIERGEYDDFEKWIHNTEQSIVYMTEYLEAVISLNRQKELKIESISLSKKLSSLVESFKLKPQYRNNTFVYTGDPIEKFSCDVELFEIIIENLLKNAVQYSKDGSIIMIYTWEQEDSYIIEIQDEGEGIPKEELEKIFHPFTRGNQKNMAFSPGIGLGLTIAKQHVLRMKGMISVESEYQKGTTVTISFPKK
jgi:PAS domain S-box-containing protein